MQCNLGTLKYSLAIINDTHVNESEEHCTSPFPVNQRANRRMRHVVDSLNQRDIDFVVHAGDLIHPVPALPDNYAQAAALFKSHVAELRHPIHLTPGNHDIGDKPNDWAPTASICPTYIELWNKHFGADYHAFEHGGDTFVIINAQLVNSGLARESEQAQWLEQVLTNAAGKRIFVFSHYPIYFAHADEQENYDNIGEPGRGWLLELLNKHKVEALFSAHVHNFWYNRHGVTDCYLLPSTAFVRQDYSEMYRTPPEANDEAGRNDLSKLGYAVLHVFERGHTIELVRTFGAERAKDQPIKEHTHNPSILHPRLDQVCAFGFDMRHNWMEFAEIPPTGGLDEFDRKEVRNDYPLMAMWQLGVQKLRIPLSDLLYARNRERLRHLQKQGHAFTLFTFGAPNEREQRLIVENQDIISAWEVTLNWNRLQAAAPVLGATARQVDAPLYLSRLRSGEELRAEAGKYYHVINQGFVAADQEQMKTLLGHPHLGDAIQGFVFRVSAERHPLDAIREASTIARELGVNASVHIRMCGVNPADAQNNDDWVSARLAETVLAAAAFDNVAVFADTFTDIDRGYFVRRGVLNRLCNPRPAFHLVQTLKNALLGAQQPIKIESVVRKADLTEIVGCGDTLRVILKITTDASSGTTFVVASEGET